MELVGKLINKKYYLENIVSQNALYTRYWGKDVIADHPVEIHLISGSLMSRRVSDVIRFKNVGAKLIDLSHWALLPVIEVGEFFERGYIVYERFEGRSLKELCNAGVVSNYTVAQKAELVRNIAHALAYVHQSGILHRALVPEFVFVGEKGTEVALHGFGFVYIIDWPSNYPEDLIEEIMPFFPPEQKGVIRRPIDEKSDLFSLGVMLYKLLTGRFPYDAKNLHALVFFDDLVKPRDINPDVGEVLQEIVLCLLQKEPNKRYPNAEALVSDLQRVIEGKENFRIGGEKKSLHVNYRISLYGRKKEIDLLCNNFLHAQKGMGNAVLVIGPSGSGKTRLCEEFREKVLQKGGIFFQTKCHRELIYSPYSALYGLFDSILAFYRTGDELTKDNIRKLCSACAIASCEFISKIHPDLKEILSDITAGDTCEKTEEVRNPIPTIVRFLCAFEKLGQAIVLLVDDFQWIDEGSMRVIEELVGHCANLRMMMVCTVRDEDRGFMESHRSDFVKLVDDTIFLHPLDEIDMEGFVAEMIGEERERVKKLAKEVWKMSGGNPLHAQAVLKNMVENNLLAFDGAVWEYRPETGPSDVFPSLFNLIIEQVQSFGEKERIVIECAAVIGKAVDCHLISEILDSDVEDIFCAIEKARRAHIFTESDDETHTVQFIHDRVKEIFLDNIPFERKMEIHRMVARALASMEESNESYAFEIAHHFWEANDFQNAARYLYAAAKISKEKHAYRDAERFYRRTIEALKNIGVYDGEQMIECKLELANVAVMVGECDDAIDILHEILPALATKEKRAYAHFILCTAYYRKADWKNCEAHAAKGLSILGDVVPLSKIGIIFALVKELGIHFIHVALPFIFVKRRPGAETQRYRQIVEFLEPLAMTYALNSPLKLVWSNFHALNISEKHIGPSAELATSYYAVGALYMSIPFFSIAEKYLRKAQNLNESLGSRWGLAKTLELLGYYYEWQAMFDEAITYFEKAKNIFHELGDLKEYAMVLNGLEHCYYYTAQYDRAIEINDEYYEVSRRSGDDYSLGAALIYFSQYYREKGNVEKSREYAMRARDLSKHKEIWFNYCSALNELGCCEYEMGNVTYAIEYFEKAKELHEKNNFLKQYIVPVYPNLAHAYIEKYFSNSREMGKDITKRKIVKACKEAIAKTRNWPTHHAAALCAIARYYAILGKNKKAYRYFQKAIAHAKRALRPFEQIRALVALGNFHLQCGHEMDARSIFEEAYRLCVEVRCEAYGAKICQLLGVNQFDEKTPIERYLDKVRPLLYAQAARELVEKSGYEEMLAKTFETVMDISGSPCGVFVLVREHEFSQHIVANRGLVEGKYEEVNSIVEMCVQNKQENESLEHGEFIAFPLSIDESIIGVLVIENKGSQGKLSKSDVQVISLFLKSLSQMGRSGREKGMYAREAISFATEQKVQKAIDYIKNNFTSDISREGLAAHLDINPDHLGKAFKLITGEKIGDYINRLRVEMAAERLIRTNEKIIEIAYAVGFESLSTFNRAFAKVMGLSPLEYRKIQREMVNKLIPKD
ncbi:MAG: AAA family ATPase [Spirochaetes bacterium]|nr:AAA family ATPase [Spirochaetota bacterium]